MRSTVLLLALLSGGCLVEYVLPAEATTDVQSTGLQTTDVSPTGDTGPGGTDAVTTGDPTGPETGTQTGADPCADGLTRCGDACVDLRADDEHCGGCLEVCKSDERCVASECRDVLAVDCEACPCEACPPGDGLLASTTGDGGGGGGDEGDAPLQYLCCPPGPGEKALCLVGDAEDALVCPGDGA